LCPGPCLSLLPFAEQAHLNHLAVAERKDIGNAPMDPFRDDDFVASDNEPLHLATSFGPGAARLACIMPPLLVGAWTRVPF
jgi:hypothetical protein